MNSDCFVFVEERDEFRMWQGLVGPYYTPAVDSLGNLSWTNNGNLVNPPTVNVSGRGLTITGIVDTAGDLPASAPQYTCYLVGITAPYHAYIFDGTSWTDIGIVGKGDTGADGFSPIVTVTTITGGHEVSIEDANGTQTFDVIDGAPGQGVPSGGTTGQVLAKASGTDYDTEWVTRANIVNPNLLDNWYFVGGGSQLGYGTFPVNQRGQASYSANSTYGVDRWKLRFDDGGSCTVGADGVTISGGSRTMAMAQTYPNGGKDLCGKTVTFSVWFTSLTGNAEIAVGNATNATNKGTVIGTKGVDSSGLATLTVEIPSTLANAYLNFIIGCTTGSAFTISAVKLELGDSQTLAHQEGSTWVLNEMPDFREQLQKCKYYFERLTGQYVNFGSGFANNATTAYVWGNISPKNKIVDPAKITLNGTIYIWTVGAMGASGKTSTSIVDGRCGPNGTFFIGLSTADLTQGAPVACQIRDTSTYIDFSAEP